MHRPLRSEATVDQKSSQACTTHASLFPSEQKIRGGRSDPRVSRNIRRTLKIPSREASALPQSNAGPACN
ncbi:uncharacterized protein BDZ83DRAFT_601077 [Colletotrichum acutatum]|uniref:Uncharacterized protein n=1 Tax=Glomerella acutata TaxID=27357 RepID=A0AAD8XP80_GLOAC|nr:uncharacterized protein BDZ83DRAFT_601077 [Colletotrichum acutatum]KAK1730908.1 hypothetical protein BDZ83DRAFT_601077 [Colletotrichum acutatum]